MKKEVGLSMLFKHTDWPTEMSQEQRQRLLQEKLARVEVYEKLHSIHFQPLRRTLCLEQK